MTETTVRGVRLPDEIWDALQREAAKAEVSTSELIRTILANHIEAPPQCGEHSGAGRPKEST